MVDEKGNKYKKPPLGVEPREIWIERRKEELGKAIARYLQAGLEIKKEWIEEYFSYL